MKRTMRLELSILDDDEDEKIETVQRGSRRELAKKRTRIEKRNISKQKSPSLTVSEDVYQTLHTMGKFLTQPEGTTESIEKEVLPLNQEINKEEVIKERTITAKLENLIEEVQDLEDIVTVEETVHKKEEDILEEDIDELKKAIQEKENLLKEVQDLEENIHKNLLKQMQNLELENQQEENKIENLKDSKEIQKESNVTQVLTTVQEPREELPSSQVSIGEEKREIPETLLETTKEDAKERETNEKLKSVQDLVNEITNARHKSKAQIEAIVNEAIENSKIEQSLEDIYMEAAFIDDSLDKNLTQKEIDHIINNFFKHKAPGPTFLNITLEELKEHIDEQITLIMDYQ